MFNQIQISAEDRVYHRFLWRKNISYPPKDFQWKRLPFGDKPAPDLSISALRFLANKHLQSFPLASHVISAHCYMDHLATSFPSDTQALKVKQNVNSILKSGKFAVKGWHSNSLLVDEFTDTAQTEILGHCWNKASDNFRPNFEVSLQEPVTKRSILSAAAKLWDPLGIFAPLTLNLRLLLQSLWQLGISWDATLPNSIIQRCKQILNQISALQNFQIPRRLKPDLITGPVEHHGFCDGGEQAYGAVIWLRWPSGQTYDLKFVASKAYVAPLKKKSIPRLELMAAVILVRLVTTVTSVIKISEMTLWTDSATVLHWLHLPSSNFKPFVSTRIQEIKEAIPEAPNCFRYVKSSLNPADVLTKLVEKFKLSSWHEGPQFLTQAKENWPCFLPTKNIALSTKEEKKILALNSCATIVDDFEDHLLKRTSSWSKLIRIAAWLKRVKLNQNSRSAVLTPDELYYAKFNLFWLAQSDLRTAKYQSMRKKLNLKPSTEELRLLRIH